MKSLRLELSLKASSTGNRELAASRQRHPTRWGDISAEGVPGGNAPHSDPSCWCPSCLYVCPGSVTFPGSRAAIPKSSKRRFQLSQQHHGNANYLFLKTVAIVGCSGKRASQSAKIRRMCCGLLGWWHATVTHQPEILIKTQLPEKQRHIFVVSGM